ncbi:MAG: c-type heme family protein [Planktothrix sp.]
MSLIQPNKIIPSLKLNQKFTLLLVIVFLIGTVLSGIVLSGVLNANARMQFNSEAMILLKTMNAVRDYTHTQVTSHLEAQIETEFLPQSVPTYASREVFEILRKDPEWNQFFYKEATLNPTNLRDKADPFEEKLIAQFRNDPNLKQLESFREFPTGKVFYIARPNQISEASCLECHSQPNKAPKSLIDRYGSENGFGWKLNEIVGAQVIFVPANTVYHRMRQSQIIIISIVVGIFAVTIFLVNIWLKRYVVKPLKRMANAAEAISTGNMDAEFEQKSTDEVGTLAKSFTRMKISLQMAMQRLGQHRN